MSVDPATLQLELTQLPEAGRWVSRPEIEELPGLLADGETVRAGATGWLIESGKLAMRTWVIVATSERLLCLMKTGPTLRKAEVLVSTMKACYTDARLGYHEVIIESSSGKMIVSGMPKEAAVALSTALAAEITRHAKSAPAPRPAVAASSPAYGVPPQAATAPATAAPHGDVLAACVEKIRKLDAELEQTKKRLAAVEEVLRRAAARSAAAKAQTPTA